MNYNKGIEEGKKSQSPLWIMSGFISIIGVFLVLFKNKNPKTDGLEDEYTKGYKKGVTKRRWLFFIIGFVLSTLIFTNIDKGSNDEITKTKGLKDGKEIIKFDRGIQSDWNESFLVQGEFYQENKYDVEVTLKLNDDNTYSFNSYRSGEVVETKEGSWRTKVLKEKKIKDPISIKILILDNKYLFDFYWSALFDELCIRSYDDNFMIDRLIVSNFEERDYDIESPRGEFIITDATVTMLCKKYDRKKHVVERK